MQVDAVEEGRAVTAEQLEFFTRNNLEYQADKFLEAHGFDRNGKALVDESRNALRRGYRSR